MRLMALGIMFALGGGAAHAGPDEASELMNSKLSTSTFYESVEHVLDQPSTHAFEKSLAKTAFELSKIQLRELLELSKFSGFNDRDERWDAGAFLKAHPDLEVLFGLSFILTYANQAIANDNRIFMPKDAKLAANEKDALLHETEGQKPRLLTAYEMGTVGVPAGLTGVFFYLVHSYGKIVTEHAKKAKTAASYVGTAAATLGWISWATGVGGDLSAKAAAAARSVNDGVNSAHKIKDNLITAGKVLSIVFGAMAYTSQSVISKAVYGKGLALEPKIRQKDLDGSAANHTYVQCHLPNNTTVWALDSSDESMTIKGRWGKNSDAFATHAQPMDLFLGCALALAAKGESFDPTTIVVKAGNTRALTYPIVFYARDVASKGGLIRVDRLIDEVLPKK